MKTVGKALLGLVKGILMAFGLVTVLYALYMWGAELMTDAKELAGIDEKDFGSDFP